MNYQDLIALLKVNNAKTTDYLTADQLRALRQQMSVELPKLPGAVTLLYSGPTAQSGAAGGEFGGVRRGQLAEGNWGQTPTPDRSPQACAVACG